MGVTVAVARVAANTSTGNQDITTSDLGGLTPKAVRLIATRCVTSGTAVDGAGVYVGASDGTNEWTQGYEDQHGQATMDNEMEQDTTADRILTIYDGAADDVVEATANFVSFITNGVRINWTDAPASAFLITAEFFAGSDLSVHVGTVSLANTSNALIAITSVGFEADVVLTQLLEGTSVNSGSVCMGVVQNDRAGTVTQRCIAHGQRNGFASSVVNAVMRNDSCIARVIESSGNLDWTGAAQSFDSSGWDIQLGNSRSPSNHHMGWIALRFGSSPVVSSKVYTYSTPTGTGSNTDAGAGFQPQFVLYLATRTAVANTSETDSDGGVFGVVMTDENGDVYTQSIESEDGAADSNTQSLSNNSLNLPTHTGAAAQAASFTSFGGTGVTWNWTAVDATARQWGALAIGANSGTTYTQDVSGAITPAGALTKQTNKTLSGALATAGALAKQINKTLSGTVTSAGALAKQTNKTLSGAITSAGTLLTSLIATKTVSGTITSVGTLAKQINKVLSGTITSAGTLAKQINKTLSGTITSAGALAKQTNKTLSGAITSAGTLLTSLIATKTVSGTITSVGTLAKQINKVLNGTVTTAGVLSRQTSKNLAGSITPAGTLTNTFIPGGIIYTQTLSGTLPSSGSLTTMFIPASVVPPASPGDGGFAGGGDFYISERRRPVDTSPKRNPTRRERQKREDEEILVL